MNCTSFFIIHFLVSVFCFPSYGKTGDINNIRYAYNLTVINHAGWIITTDEEKGLLNVAHEVAGILVKDVKVNYKNASNTFSPMEWTAEKAGENLLMLRAVQREAVIIFKLEENRLTISSSNTNIVLVGLAPASQDRIIAHLIDPSGVPVTWSGTSEIEENFGGLISRKPSFLPSGNSEVMSFALGQTDGTDIHSLFDRKLDMAISFSEQTSLQRNSLDKDLLDITIPVPGNTVIKLIPDYYTHELGLPFYDRMNDSLFSTAPTVWSSWTSYYQDVRETDIIRNIDWLSANLKPYGFKYVQIDDGYDNANDTTMMHQWINNWEERGLFPRGPEWIANYIKSKGLHPGLWLVPNVYAGAVAKHPDWYLRDKSGRLILDYYTPALDYTHPGTLDWLKTLFTTLKGWGFEYFKFDGEFAITAYAPKVDKSKLYNKEINQVMAYRKRLKLIRDVIGPNSFIEGCPIGAPLDGIGYFNSYFNGADVYNTWLGSYSLFNSINTNSFLNHIVTYTMPGEGIDISPSKSLELARKTMSPRFLYTAETSEDSLKNFGVSMAEARTLVSIVSLTGVVYPLASIMPDLPEERARLLKMTMPTMPIMPVDLYSRGSDMGSYLPWEIFKHRTTDTYVHNYPEIINLKINAAAGKYNVVSFTNWRNKKYAKTISFSGKLGLPVGSPYIAFDFWEQKLFGIFHDSMEVKLDSTDTKVLLLHPFIGRPQLIGNSRHITGAFSIQSQRWDANKNNLQGICETVPGDPYSIFIYLPDGYVLKDIVIRNNPSVSSTNKQIPYKKTVSKNLLQITFTGQEQKISWQINFSHSD